MDFEAGININWPIAIILVPVGLYFGFKKWRASQAYELKKLPVPRRLSKRYDLTSQEIANRYDQKILYEKQWSIYASQLDDSIKLRKQANAKLQLLGVTVNYNFNTLRKSKHLLKQSCQRTDIENRVQAFELLPEELYNFNKVLRIWFSKKIVIIVGLLFSALLLAFIVLMVTSFGSASTGTAISTLQSAIYND